MMLAAFRAFVLIAAAILTAAAFAPRHVSAQFAGYGPAGSFFGNFATTEGVPFYNNYSAATTGNINYFWTNHGAHVGKFSDRLFIGGAASVNDGAVPEESSDWLNTLQTNINGPVTQNSQFVVLNTYGMIGITAGSRTSDFNQVGAAGAIGVAGYGISDRTGGNASSADSAWGAYWECHIATSSQGSCVGFESDVLVQVATSAVSYPASMYPLNWNAGMWTGCGAGLAATDCDMAFGVAPNTAQFNQGIVFQNNSLNPSIGSGGRGVAMTMSMEQSIRWLNDSNSPVAECWGYSIGGLQCNANLFVVNGQLVTDWGLNFSSTSSTPESGNGVYMPIQNVIATIASNDLAIEFDGAAHVRSQGSAPTLTGCGTLPFATGDDLAWAIQTGTGSPPGCVLTFAKAFNSTPLCVVSWQKNLTTMQYVATSGGVTLTQTGTSSNIINGICMGQSGG